MNKSLFLLLLFIEIIWIISQCQKNRSFSSHTITMKTQVKNKNKTGTHLISLKIENPKWEKKRKITFFSVIDSKQQNRSKQFRWFLQQFNYFFFFQTIKKKKKYICVSLFKHFSLMIKKKQNKTDGVADNK